MITDNGENNIVIGNPELKDSVIEFKGSNNILFAEENVRLEGCKINFCSNDGVMYLSSSPKHPYKMIADIWRQSAVYIGQNNYFNNTFSMIASERKNIIMGGDSVFSFGLWIRTADPHIIYDVDSKKRINESKHVVIGDHVWLGQNALILKGTTVGSGSIIGAGSVLSGKTVESNTIYAGNPARLIKSGVFFSGASVHNYTVAKTKESMVLDTDKYVFTGGKGGGIVDILEQLEKATGSEEKLEIIKNRLADSESDKYRFSVNPTQPEKTRKSFFRKG